jgi:hypothetical protein
MPTYKPLGVRTGLAIAGIVLACVASILSDAISFAFVGAGEDDVAAGLAQLAGGLFLLFSALLGAVLFLVWLHRAAVNVRAFGQQGLQFTPGWCVGWWFVPFAGLYRPYQAVSEIFRASDPESVGQDAWPWSARQVPGTLGVWWAFWVASNIASNVSGRIDDPSAAATVGLVATVLSVVAAVLLVPLMRRLAANQEEAWSKVQALGGAYPAPHGAWSAAGWAAPAHAPPLDNPYAPPAPYGEWPPRR